MEKLQDHKTTLSALLELRSDMRFNERKFHNLIESVHPSNTTSVTNLIHYLTMRSHDIRMMQDRLHILGLSSLASSESHTLSQVNSVLSWLGEKKDNDVLCDYSFASKLKLENARLLFGHHEPQKPHIMVTLSNLMLSSSQIYEHMLDAGMTVARINCAHDDEDTWLRMIELLKEASTNIGKNCKIYMDLPGPKIRVKHVIKLEKSKGINLKEGLRLRMAAYNDHNIREERAALFVDPAEILDHVKVGEHLFFDDGKFEARVEKKEDDIVFVEIIRISTKKPILKPEKGINLPQSDLKLKPLTATDLEHLPFVCKHADLVGYSFVSKPEDIDFLRDQIKDIAHNEGPKIILKIERLEAVNNLPSLLINALQNDVTGVMIARGDLAVEIGFERLSEIQEEILWICEAAHVPVVWATQVLESMNKTGFATRSEISDAAQAIKAECVMLNKGKHIVKTIKMLQNILRLQKEHLNKKRYTLRPLKIARNFIESDL